LSWNIDVTVEEPFHNRVDEAWLTMVIENVLRFEEVAITYELSLLITGDDTMHELNRTYREMDKTTDVLAFAFQEDKEFQFGPDCLKQLGEVVVSLPQAEKQALEHGHSLEKEIAVLTTHGVLHLLGYDHESLEEDAEMSARETEVVSKIKL